MRDRLIELFKKISYTPFEQCNIEANLATQFTEYALNHIVDELLANGVIVPPCKVGQTVYQTILLKDKTGFIVERKVVGFHMGDFPELRGHKRKQYLIVYNDVTNSITHIDINQIDKTVFYTKEEAEQALKGGEEE